MAISRSRRIFPFSWGEDFARGGCRCSERCPKALQDHQEGLRSLPAAFPSASLPPRSHPKEIFPGHPLGSSGTFCRVSDSKNAVPHSLLEAWNWRFSVPGGPGSLCACPPALVGKRSLKSPSVVHTQGKLSPGILPIQPLYKKGRCLLIRSGGLQIFACFHSDGEPTHTINTFFPHALSSLPNHIITKPGPAGE